MNSDMTSILRLRGAFAAVSVRGVGFVYGEVVQPVDRSGTFTLRPWGVSDARRFALRDVVSASAAATTRAEYRAIAAKQRDTLGGGSSDPSTLIVGAKVDVVIRVADGLRTRNEAWRGTVVRLLPDLIEFALVGCGDRTIEFTREQLVSWCLCRDGGRGDGGKAKINRARLGLPERNGR